MSDEFDIDDEPCECCGTTDQRDAYARRKLHRSLRGQTLYLWDLGPSTDAGPSGLWASNVHWLAPASVVADLLAWWNLPLAPGVYEVTEDRVEPSERTAPSVEKVNAILRPPSPAPLSLRRVAGAPMCALTEFSTCAVFGKNVPVLLNVEYLDTVVPGWREGAGYTAEHESGKPLSQVVFRNADGSIVACVMPVRYRA
ncbi:MAG: hypothetical protein ACLGHT_09780 [Acidimicrobiia bacterium]